MKKVNNMTFSGYEECDMCSKYYFFEETIPICKKCDLSMCEDCRYNDFCCNLCIKNNDYTMKLLSHIYSIKIKNDTFEDDIIDEHDINVLKKGIEFILKCKLNNKIYN